MRDKGRRRERGRGEKERGPQHAQRCRKLKLRVAQQGVSKATHCLRCGCDQRREAATHVNFASELSSNAALSRNTASVDLVLQEASNHGVAVLKCDSTSSVCLLPTKPRRNLGRDTMVNANKKCYRFGNVGRQSGVFDRTPTARMSVLDAHTLPHFSAC